MERRPRCWRRSWRAFERETPPSRRKLPPARAPSLPRFRCLGLFVFSLLVVTCEQEAGGAAGVTEAQVEAVSKLLREAQQGLEEQLQKALRAKRRQSAAVAPPPDASTQRLASLWAAYKVLHCSVLSCLVDELVRAGPMPSWPPSTKLLSPLAMLPRCRS